MSVERGELVHALVPFARAAGGRPSGSIGGIFIIPNATFFAELILFMLVLGIVAKWILPSIQQALTDREQTVRGGLHAADEGRVESERLERERLVVLEGGREEARRLIDEARRRADGLREAARARADAERHQRLGQALASFEAERPLLRADALRGVGALVAVAAEQVLGGPVDMGHHVQVVDAAVEAQAAAGVSSGVSGAAE